MTQFYTVARKLGYLPAFLVCLLFGAQRSWAQTPYPLASGTYNEKFDAISTWEANFAGGTGANRFGVASPQPTLPNTNTVFSSGSGGGVQKGAGAIVLLATGTTDGQNASAFDLYLDFTGSAAGSISLDWAEVNNSTGNRQATFKLQTNTGANGTFVDLPGSNVVVTNTIATSGSLTSISLPTAFTNKPDAKIRFFLVTSSGGTTGSRPKFSIDNLVVTGTTSDTPTPTASITTTAPATASSYCITTTNGASLSVAFTTTGSFTGDFKAQLSNAVGVFPSNTTDNIIGTGASSPIAAIIPAGTATGAGYRVRVVSDAPATYGTNNGSNLTISSAITTNDVVVSPADNQTIALAATGTQLTARAAVGSTFTWAYGTSITGPFNTPLASASGATYQPKGADFGVAGTYYVVANTTLTTTCGSASGQSAPVAVTVTVPAPSEIVTSLAAVPAFGSTVTGAASTAQSFTVSGTGLTSPVLITPPAGFEIRTGTQPFACCAITLQPSNGTVGATTIDVRFAPTAAQSYQAAIPVTSSGATAQSVAVNGTSTAPVYPATVSTAPLTDITTTSATTGGTIEPDGGSPVTARGVVWATTPAPVLGTALTTDGTNAGTFTSTITGLAPNTTYYVRAYATNALGTAYGEELTLKTEAVQLAAEPTQSATLVAGQVSTTSIQLILNGGNGAKHLVLARLGESVNATPVDATTYTGNTAFGQGTQLGTGNYVVYAGARDTVTVSSLQPGLGYTFAVFEYNDNNTPHAENYLATAPGTLAQTTKALPANLVLEENFDYAPGSLLTGNNWTAHSTGANPITVAATGTGLSYESYSASNIGKAVTLATSGEDINRKFAPLYARTPVYTSFLVNVASASTAGDYFFHLGTSTMNTSFYKSRTFVRRTAAGKIQFGVSNSSTAPTYTTASYDLGTTYLLVVKYVFDENGGTTQLFVNPAVAVEPTTAETSATETSGSPTEIGAVALRQGAAANAAVLTVDGIRVGNTYQVVRTGQSCQEPAPSFAASTVCVGNTTVFTDASSVVETDATYSWDVDGDGQQDYTTKGNLSHTYAAAGTYTVALTITQGTCSATYKQEVTVRALPTATLSGTATICAGTSTKLALQLTGTAPWMVSYSADGGATATTLTVNAADVSSTGEYQLTVSPTAITTYTLLSVTDANCTGLAPTGSATVTVNAKPVLTLPTVPATNATAGLRGASVAFAATATGSTPAPSLVYTIVKNGTATPITSPYVFPLGTTVVTATATNDCGSTTGTFAVTVQTPAFITVLHQNADGQVANNAIKPNLQLVNNTTAAIAYQDLKVRYWLTVEDFAAMVATIDYAQLGTSGVKAQYVALDQPAQGAFGYVEYSFTAAGSLPAGGNSGVIQSRLNKSTWTNFNEADDYSYATSTSYVKNERITVYRNGELVAGIEPALVTNVAPKLVVLSQNKEKKTTSNTISTYLQVRNDGTAPVAYKDLTVRYWFSPEGTQPLNGYIDYAQLGNNNVAVSFGKVGTETYAELRFAAGLGTFSPLSNTGNIQYRIAKSDWSNFNQANDFSYVAASNVFAQTTHITAYVNGTLVYGQEPTGATGTRNTTAAVLGTQSAAGAKAVVSSYPNPFTGSTTIAFTAAQSQDYQLEIYDINGRLVKKLQSGKAQAGQLVEVEWQAENAPAGLYLARLTTGNTVQQVKLVLQ